MRPFFYLDLLEDHLGRALDGHRQWLATEDADRREAMADAAYNGLLDAIDAIHGHATFLARELIEIDRTRRSLLSAIDDDEADFDFDLMAHPLRPFWTHPLSLLQNIGFFPIRVVEWFFLRRVPRHRDVLEKVRRLKARKGDHPAADGAARRQEMDRLRHRTWNLERALAELHDVEADAPLPTDLANALGLSVDQSVARMRRSGGRRRERTERIDTMIAAIDELPRATFADQIYAERIATYRHVLETVEGLIEEIRDSHAIGRLLDGARQRMEVLFPTAREARLASLVADDEAARLLASVRVLLGVLVRLSGKEVSPNLEVARPRRTLGDVARIERRLKTGRRARLARWQADQGTADLRTARSLIRCRTIQARRLSTLLEETVASPDPIDRFFGDLRRALGTMTYRVRNPWRIYREWIRDMAYHRRFTSGMAERILAMTIGAVLQHLLALGRAFLALLVWAPSYVLYLFRRRRARRLRAEVEKVLREFAEELVLMADGFLVPGERMADHLFRIDEEGQAAAGPKQAPAEPPQALAETARDVRSILSTLHRAHTWHLTFGTAYLDTSDAAEAVAGLESCQAHLRDRFRAIRDRLQRTSIACQREAAFLDRLAAGLAPAAPLDRRPVFVALLRLHESMRAAGLDTRALDPLVASAHRGSKERRLLYLWRRGWDFARMTAILSRAARTLDQGATFGNGPGSRYARQLDRSLEALAGRRYSTADCALDEAAG